MPCHERGWAKGAQVGEQAMKSFNNFLNSTGTDEHFSITFSNSDSIKVIIVVACYGVNICRKYQFLSYSAYFFILFFYSLTHGEIV